MLGVPHIRVGKFSDPYIINVLCIKKVNDTVFQSGLEAEDEDAPEDQD